MCVCVVGGGSLKGLLCYNMRSILTGGEGGGAKILSLYMSVEQSGKKVRRGKYNMYGEKSL